MACSKIVFQSRAEAKNHARKNLHVGSARPYRCAHPNEHGGQVVWHLTSQTGAESRRIARSNAERAAQALLRAVEQIQVVSPGLAPRCRCERSQPLVDDGEVRCLHCGRAVA